MRSIGHFSATVFEPILVNGAGEGGLSRLPGVTSNTALFDRKSAAEKEKSRTVSRHYSVTDADIYQCLSDEIFLHAAPSR